mgnify:CR=1 FL=1
MLEQHPVSFCCRETFSNILSIRVPSQTHYAKLKSGIHLLHNTEKLDEDEDEECDWLACQKYSEYQLEDSEDPNSIEKVYRCKVYQLEDGLSLIPARLIKSIQHFPKVPTKDNLFFLNRFQFSLFSSRPVSSLLKVSGTLFEIHMVTCTKQGFLKTIMKLMCKQ